MNKAVQIFNMGDFERIFGGLDSRSEASYAIQQFFLNGGSEAWVVRTATKDEAGADPAASKINISDNNGGVALNLEASNEGKWGDHVGITIDYPTQTPNTQFNMVLTEYDEISPRRRSVRSEEFRNLSMDGSEPRYVWNIINDQNSGSKLVRLNTKPTGTKLPKIIGTMSDHIQVPIAINSDNLTIGVSIGNVSTEATLKAKPVSLPQLRTLLEAAIRSSKPENPAFSSATVEILGDRLWIQAGPSDPAAIITFSDPDPASPTASELKLTGPAVVSNAQEYILSNGTDGAPPSATELIGESVPIKTGIYALDEVDLFNILCIPRTAELDSPGDAAVITVANSYCEKRRAFFVVDPPKDIVEVQAIKDWLLQHDTLRHKNAALYFPRVKIPDPLDEYRLKARGSSGTIAGLYARIDTNRGVWKAPAGTEGVMAYVQELECKLTDDQNGTLNQLAINCLRSFPVYGNICWGARTLDGADQKSSEWKYIPVRRLALFLEESLYRGTKWVVFEPNDEPLWAQIRLNVGAFMHSLFRQGAFQGVTPTRGLLREVR